MATELIDEYINRGAIEADTNFFLAKLSLVKKTFDEINSTEISIKSTGGTQQLVSSLNAVTTANITAAQSTNQLTKTQEQLEKQTQNNTKSATAEQKSTKDLADERALLTKALKDQEVSYANLYLTQGKNHPLTLQAKADVLETKGVLDDLNHSIGRYGDNVGNYSSAFQGYANTLRGLRGPQNYLVRHSVLAQIKQTNSGY